MTKHGHGLPRKRPGRSAKGEIQSDLPELEPLDELPELEPVEELPELEELEEDIGPVKGECVDTDEDGFETVITLTVPDMPKKEVPDAVEGPLQRIAGSFRSKLRHRKVLVRFAGDGLIGSAVKDLVEERLEPVKPLMVVVRRGFGDECVHQGELPIVKLESTSVDRTVRVKVATGECEQEDLMVALQPHIDGLVESVPARRVTFLFTGNAKPDAAIREMLSTKMREAGARSTTVGARLLFDLDLAERVRVTTARDKVSVDISLEGDDAECIDGISFVLADHKKDFDGKSARLHVRSGAAAVQDFCVDFARGAGASLVELGGEGDAEIVWPPMLSVRAGQEMEFRMTPNGRSRKAVLAAFVRELADHHEETAGKDVVIDWPAEIEFDQEVSDVLAGAIKHMAPHRLACTFNGEDREPFVPEPVKFGADGDVRTIVVESDAGKPKELQRAMDRRLPEHRGELSGAAVRIEVHGDAPLTRSVRNSLCAAVVDAGAAQVDLSEGGEIDRVHPLMLTVEQGKHGLQITCSPGDRDERQQQRAIARELGGVEIALQSVTIVESPSAEHVAKFALEQGAAEIVLDGAERRRLHPPLFEAIQQRGRKLRLVADPTGDDLKDRRMIDAELPARLDEAAPLAGAQVTLVWPGGTADTDGVQHIAEALLAREVAVLKLERAEGEVEQMHPDPSTQPAEAGALLSLLGRSDAASPPMVLLAVADGDGEEHLQAVLAELNEHLAKFTGRAVLLVVQDRGDDRPVRAVTPLARLLAQAVPQTASATLLFRGPDDQGRPHFEVLHSSVAALPVGGAFGDPRAGSAS